jgi:CheY-like chemotaxis protein
VASLVFTEKPEEKKQQIEIQKIEGKPVILIVEDNPDNMITAKAILEDKYTILEAVDGTQGILMAKKHTPHLILMDIALPGIDGIEAFKAIRNIGQLAHIPVVALTASAMTIDRESILSHGFDGYIAKPIDEKIFFNTINKVLYGT